jgi:branched-chain amino acid transport system permease protein
LLAGIFLGVAEALTGFFWSSDWAPGLSIMLLLAILILFPQGFLSRSAT